MVFYSDRNFDFFFFSFFRSRSMFVFIFYSKSESSFTLVFWIFIMYEISLNLRFYCCCCSYFVCDLCDMFSIVWFFPLLWKGWTFPVPVVACFPFFYWKNTQKFNLDGEITAIIKCLFLFCLLLLICYLFNCILKLNNFLDFIYSILPRSGLYLCFIFSLIKHIFFKKTW